jgi:hypothetical protein
MANKVDEIAAIPDENTIELSAFSREDSFSWTLHWDGLPYRVYINSSLPRPSEIAWYLSSLKEKVEH